MQFSIIIKAPVQRVWDTMLGERTYRLWTEAFMPGSHYVGDWSKGSKMLFFAPGEKGEMGMVSRINENRPLEFISIEHLGVVREGNEDYIGEEARVWAGAFENYIFREIDGATEVLVDLVGPDAIERYREMFETAWPKALQRLRELAEQHEKSYIKKRRKSITRIPSRRRKSRM
jgi:hypothetical protein